MKILSCFSLLLLIFSQIHSQTGSISGNVFYKYNNYVGNRADAGSTVYFLKNKMVIKQADCDLAGNFKADLDTGYYTVCVVSKNTNNSPEGGMDDLTMAMAFLQLQYKSEREDSVSAAKVALTALENSFTPKDEYRYNLKKKEKTANENYNRMMTDSISISKLKYQSTVLSFVKYQIDNYPILKSIGFYSPVLINKHKFDFIKVLPGKEERIVVDFGITYL